MLFFNIVICGLVGHRWGPVSPWYWRGEGPDNTDRIDAVRICSRCGKQEYGAPQ